ncbi:MAG: DNA-3-methyladenine glycosylase I [Chloroflexota bacterium]|nr:DNA-3-methyladenine glycosylase I [Chloroflexota bacterium]
MPHSIEIPPRQRPGGDGGYLEEMTKAIFQAGFSWDVIRNKWPNFQKAFDQFDVATVAAYDVPDVERLLSDAGIVRNGRKINGTIENAGTILALSQQHGSFFDYLRTLDDLSYDQRRKQLTKQFKGLGRTSCFVFLWCVDEPVPDWENR